MGTLRVPWRMGGWVVHSLELGLTMRGGWDVRTWSHGNSSSSLENGSRAILWADEPCSFSIKDVTAIRANPDWTIALAASTIRARFARSELVASTMCVQFARTRIGFLGEWVDGSSILWSWVLLCTVDGHSRFQRQGCVCNSRVRACCFNDPRAIRANVHWTIALVASTISVQ